MKFLGVRFVAMACAVGLVATCMPTRVDGAEDLGIQCIVETVPNANMLRFRLFYVNPKLSVGIVFSRYQNLYIEEQKGNLAQPKLMRRLQAIDGVAAVTFDGDEFSVERAIVFAWSEVVPEVLSVLAEELNYGKTVRLMRPLPELPPTNLFFETQTGFRCKIGSTIRSNQVWVYSNLRVSNRRISDLSDLRNQKICVLYLEMSELEGVRDLVFDGYEIKVTSRYGYDIIDVLSDVLDLLSRKPIIA